MLITLSSLYPKHFVIKYKMIMETLYQILVAGYVRIMVRHLTLKKATIMKNAKHQVVKIATMIRHQMIT